MNRAFGLSLAGHALLALWLYFGAGHAMLDHNSPPTQAMQTRTLSEAEFQKLVQQNQKAQIVQSEDSIKTEKYIPNPTEKTFRSTQNQHVDRNTRAAKIGDHKNVLKEGLPPVENLFKLSANKNADIKLKTEEQSKDAQKGRTHSFNRKPASIGDGQSATDDYLPDVAISANTLLNTQEYIFASFYERIREKLKHQWQRLLRLELEALQRQGAPMFQGERITKLRIFMDSNGQVKTIHKMGTAGYEELDKAAVSAFKVASPFPNPPKAMIEKNKGTLQIDWHFVVMGSQNGMQIQLQRRDSI